MGEDWYDYDHESLGNKVARFMQRLSEKSDRRISASAGNLLLVTGLGLFIVAFVSVLVLIASAFNAWITRGEEVALVDVALRHPGEVKVLSSIREDGTAGSSRVS